MPTANVRGDRAQRSFTVTDQGTGPVLSLPELGPVQQVADVALVAPGGLGGVYHDSGSGVQAVVTWNETPQAARGFDLQYRGRQGGSGTWDTWSADSGIAIPDPTARHLTVGGSSFLTRNPVQVRLRTVGNGELSDWCTPFQMSMGSGNVGNN